MKAGYAQVCVTPWLGSLMEGLGQPDPCSAIHDDLFMRALAISDGDREAVLIGCDLLFFERAVVDRFKGAIGRVLDLTPRQILINASHNHAGPLLSHWSYSDGPDPEYLDRVEAAMIEAVVQARSRLTDVTLWAGMTRTNMPVSRRKPTPDGTVEWKPYRKGTICQALPVCMLKDDRNELVALLFSVSCHPSSWYEPQISADYPGVAQRRLNAHFKTECAMFLQGAGGDTKPRTVADGEERWRHGRWEDVEEAGRDVADAVIALVDKGLVRCKPDLRIHYEDIRWSMETLPTRTELEQIEANPPEFKREVRQKWARAMLRKLDCHGRLPDAVPVGLHVVQLGKGLRFIGLEGESVADLGLLTLNCYDRGVTFPLGYTNGTQLYLPSSRMRKERGYEVDSFYEYHWPSFLAVGGDTLIETALRRLQQTGAIPNDAP
ncbi:MAG: hypothetical protein HY343_13535 [Lentisphaerae bacterium]|nr:hypothetical protein [Lentisphaerota bacterium]